MYRFMIIYKDNILCQSEEYPVKGMASAIARNYVYRLEQEWKRVKYEYKLNDFMIKVIDRNQNSVYEVQLR